MTRGPRLSLAASCQRGGRRYVAGYLVGDARWVLVAEVDVFEVDGVPDLRVAYRASLSEVGRDRAAALLSHLLGGEALRGISFRPSDVRQLWFRADDAARELRQPRVLRQ